MLGNAELVPAMLSWSFSILLYGIAIHKFFAYRTTKQWQMDSRTVKGIVWVVMGLVTAQVALLIGAVTDLGATADTPVVMLNESSFVNWCNVPGTPVALLVQIFLARRAAHFIEVRWLRRVFLVVVTLFTAVGFAGSLFFNVLSLLSFYRPSYQMFFLKTVVRALGAYLFPAALTDVLLTCVLYTGVRKHIVGFNRNFDWQLEMVSRIALQTGTQTALVASVGSIVAIIALKTHAFVLGFILTVFIHPLPMLYSLSLLATLDVRQTIRDNAEVVSALPADLEGVVSFQPNNLLKHRTTSSRGASSIHLPQTMELQAAGGMLSALERGPPVQFAKH